MNRTPSARRQGSTPSRGKGRQPYHHGDLRRVLIDAALQLVAEGGVEAVSVREAARRAGVSPGAPFRHFPNRDALIAAVAEEAQQRFRSEIASVTASVRAEDPLTRLRSLGLAYLRWAMHNPYHFEVISCGRYFSHDKSAAVSRDNAELIGITEGILAEAAAAGALRTADLKLLQIAARALVYGFARMRIDGHFPRWGVAPADVDRLAEGILDLFLDGISSRVG